MSEDAAKSQDTFRELGDGLVMRAATFEDRGPVSMLHGTMLAGSDEALPSERMIAFVFDLMSGTHPTFRASDFTLVEEKATGKIVSSMCLLSQTWTYEGIPFPLGSPR